MTFANSLAWLVVCLNLIAGAAVVTHKLRPLSWAWLEEAAVWSFGAQNFVAVCALIALAIR